MRREAMMMASNVEFVIGVGELPAWIKSRLSYSGRSISDLAAEIGASKQFVHGVIRGKTAPGEKLLGALGLDLAYRVVGSEPELIVEVVHARLYLYQVLNSSGLNAKDFSKKMGIPKQFLMLILSGKRPVSKKTIAAIGLEPVYRAKKAAPPKKPRKATKT